VEPYIDGCHIRRYLALFSYVDKSSVNIDDFSWELALFFYLFEMTIRSYGWRLNSQFLEIVIIIYYNRQIWLSIAQ
jgi:hypothetical protein